MSVAKLSAAATNLTKAAIVAGKPVLAKAVKYGRVEMRPPSLSEIPQIRAGVNNIISAYRTGRWKQLSVKEAWLNTLVTIEVVCWFFVGECIGKRSLIGYQV